MIQKYLSFSREIENRYEVLSLIQTQAVRRGGPTASTSVKRRSKARSVSACSAGGASSTVIEARLTVNDHHNLPHNGHQTYSQAFVAATSMSAVAAATALLPPQQPTRFRDMDLLLDMLGMDQQQQQTTVLEQQQTRLESSSNSNIATKIVNQTNGGSLVVSQSQDAYSDLLVMSPANSVEEDGAGSGYIAETLAIHLASMPSVAAMRSSRPRESNTQQQQIILQQRPTSVIVASSSFGSSLTDFGGGQVSSRDDGCKVSPDEAEGILGLVSLPVVGGNKPDIYRPVSSTASNNTKKMTHSGSSGSLSTMISAPTANLFSRTKAVTDSLFSFVSCGGTTATTTTTVAAGSSSTSGSVAEPIAAPFAAIAAKQQQQQPAVVARSEAAALNSALNSSSGRSFNFASAKEFTMEEDTLLRELFGDMADNGTELEKLSPYIGDVCVILKEPSNGENSGRGGVPSSMASTSNLPMDIQVIDFGPAGTGFDDYEIPVFGGGNHHGGGEYRVKSEPGLEVDLKDFPELLAPLTPSQETPLHQEDDEVGEVEDFGGLYSRSRRMPTTVPVKYEMDRSSPEAAGGLFWTQLQVWWCSYFLF